jgi:hypothetical protein
MVIKIVNEELYQSLATEVNFPTSETIEITYTDGERRERLVAVGKHREDDFLNTFGFKIIG